MKESNKSGHPASANETGQFVPPELILFTKQLRNIKHWFCNYCDMQKAKGDGSIECLGFRLVDLEESIDKTVDIISNVVMYEFREFHYYNSDDE